MIAWIAVHEFEIVGERLPGDAMGLVCHKMIVLPIMNREEAMRVVEDKGRVTAGSAVCKQRHMLSLDTLGTWYNS
jgi:hypothetical protein